MLSYRNYKLNQLLEGKEQKPKAKPESVINEVTVTTPSPSRLRQLTDKLKKANNG